jgi:Flp pilus assembly protein protease CpaA
MDFLPAISILAIIVHGDLLGWPSPNLPTSITAILRIMGCFSNPVAAVHTLLRSTAVFVAGLLLFPRAAPGAGDAKPMTAMVFFIGHDHLFPSLFFMTFCGGTLPLAIIAREKFRLQRLISLRAVFGPSSTEAAGSTIATEHLTCAAGLPSPPQA